MVYIRGRHRKKDSHKPPPEDLDLGQVKKTYQQLEEANRRIQETQIEMIFKFAVAAEYRDNDTGAHILRISDYATMLGRASGLSRRQIEILRYASPMHDIGKLGIPDAILQKRGKLTPAEFEIMKTHTIIGYRIFGNSKSELLNAAAEISITHHEKYDGTGYPYGLKGENIPIFGRIVAIVDIFDALVSKRCYKDEMTFEEAFAEIKALSGRHLDPKLIEIFVKMKNTIKKIYDANKSIESFLTESESLPH